MPIVSIQSELIRGKKEGFAVPLFDVFDSQSIDGIIAAMAEANVPGIVGVYSGTFDQPNAKALAAYALAQMRDLPAAASLMLDHGSSLEQCMRAIQCGFSDVMFDGSKLPIEENIATTRAIVRFAHAVGVHVEAELGHVGSGNEYQEFGGRRKGFTNPSDVERFVAETGVDFLAVAIGTAHGVYAGDPFIDLELLADIRRRVDIPLVMHGGSGLSEAQFLSAIQGGVSKINVATELINTAAKRMKVECLSEKSSYFSITTTALKTYQERSAYYLQLFGAHDQAA